MAQNHRWPSFDPAHQYYLRDNHGVIWFVDTQYENGVVTAVTSGGSISVALRVLRDLRGPLHILKELDEVLGSFPTIDPQPKLTEPQQVVVATTEAEARKLNG